MIRKTLALCLLASFCSVFVFSATANAQEQEERQQRQGRQGRRGGGFGFGGGFGGRFGGGNRGDLMTLLRVEKVQKELELIDEQIDDIAKIREELGGGRGRRGRGQGRGQGRQGRGQRGQGRGNFQDLSEEERQKRLEEFRKQAEERAKQAAERAQKAKEKLAEVLLPHQMERLQEISYQVQGLAVLQDAEVAKKIGLSADQTKKLKEVSDANAEEFRTKIRELFQSGGFQEAQAKMAEMRKAGDEKVLAVLSEDQKKAFEELKGEKFEMPENAFGRGRGGRGGQGGRRGGGQGGRPQRPERPARPSGDDNDA